MALDSPGPYLSRHHLRNPYRGVRCSLRTNRMRMVARSYPYSPTNVKRDSRLFIINLLNTRSRSLAWLIIEAGPKNHSINDSIMAKGVNWNQTIFFSIANSDRKRLRTQIVSCKLLAPSFASQIFGAWQFSFDRLKPKTYRFKGQKPTQTWCARSLRSLGFPVFICCDYSYCLCVGRLSFLFFFFRFSRCILLFSASSAMSTLQPTNGTIS